MSETKYPTNKINIKGKKFKNLTRNWDLNKKKLEERDEIRTQRNGFHPKKSKESHQEERSHQKKLKSSLGRERKYTHLKTWISKKNLTTKAISKKAYKMSPGKKISQKEVKILTRKRVSKTARQRRMLMKLGFKSIFCFFVNTKKQMMLPDNFYLWYIFYQYLFIHLSFYLHHKSILYANTKEKMTSAVIYFYHQSIYLCISFVNKRNR